MLVGGLVDDEAVDIFVAAAGWVDDFAYIFCEDVALFDRLQAVDFDTFARISLQLHEGMC